MKVAIRLLGHLSLSTLPIMPANAWMISSDSVSQGIRDHERLRKQPPRSSQLRVMGLFAQQSPIGQKPKPAGRLSTDERQGPRFAERRPLGLQLEQVPRLSRSGTSRGRKSLLPVSSSQTAAYVHGYYLWSLTRPSRPLLRPSTRTYLTFSFRYRISITALAICSILNKSSATALPMARQVSVNHRSAYS